MTYYRITLIYKLELEINKVDKDILKEYLIYILKFGTAEERLEVMSAIKIQFILHNKKLTIKS